ncbi:MAG: isoleucine--tRNA ligase [Bdellovibrionota bacterium]
MADTPVDYKSTISLPQTEFPMKGNLPVREPETIQRWRKNDIYGKMLTKNEGGTNFTLPDGPPYANGSIHIGHCLNKILKDVIIKYKNMQGYHTPFIPGWDCHGLPIEHKVMKSLTEKKIVKTDHEILELCRAEAQKWVTHQAEQFERLGILADWENPYLTMSPDYEAEEVREFARAYEKGVIYRGAKPVYWNWTLKTALADAEVEYHQHKSPAIFVNFKVSDPKTLQVLGVKDAGFVIWTTTPWTLPANVAISLHPDFDYGVFSSEKGHLVIAKALKESFEKETSLNLTEVKTIKGTDLEGLKARHPWIDRDSVIILGDHVSADAGTGAVHTAPGHGADDFRVGQKYGLDVLSPVNDSGQFTDDVPEFKGLNIFKANPLIIEKIKASGHLLAHKDIEHSYPHCWRSKTPLIFRTTPQWFLGMDLEESKIREKTLKEMNSIAFYPEWGRARFQAMMENRPDWCLSRQRIWGVPIPIYYCNTTGEPLAEPSIMMKVADLLEKNGGIEAFSKTPPEQIIGDLAAVKAKLSKTTKFPPDFGSQGFRHGKDILDVWFDSGVCHAAVQKKRKGLKFPADIYLEGSDQHRGWFNTSMLSSMATNGGTPFKALLTHGFVNDSQGKKMSKSLGNTVDPQDVTKNSGAEIIRLWTAYEDYGQDVSCGKDELTRVTETYRRIRNSMRYVLGTLHDFELEKHQVDVKKMPQIDQWALHQLNELIEKVTIAYDEYNFYKVYHALNNFFTVTLSATYLDVLKDRIYTWKKDGLPRRSSQTVIYHMTDSLIRMMAPILSFLAEESYEHFKGKTKESVFLLNFPKVHPQWNFPEVNERMKLILEVRTTTQKKLEELRAQKIIGASLEAKVNIQSKGDTLEALQKFDDLRELLIVSEVKVSGGGDEVQVAKADGEKCVRCWTYSNRLSTNPALPGICEKCTDALAGVTL